MAALLDAAVLVHALPGRARLQVPGLRGDPLLARRLAGAVARVPAVRRAAASPATGTLLVIFDLAAAGAGGAASGAGGGVAFGAGGGAAFGAVGGAAFGAVGGAVPGAGPEWDAVRAARARVLLTGGALAAVALKRWRAGPSALSASWRTYDLAGAVTLVASYPFLRRGVARLMDRGRPGSDLVMGAAGLAALLARENVLGLTVLFLSSLGPLLLAGAVAGCAAASQALAPPAQAGMEPPASAGMQPLAQGVAAGPPPAAEPPPAAGSRRRHDCTLAAAHGAAAARWGAWAMAAGLLAGLAAGSWRRALATLVAAAPAAAGLAAPLPLAAGAATAARRGTLVRSAAVVAAAGHADAVLFDGAGSLGPGQAPARAAVAALRRAGVARIGLVTGASGPAVRPLASSLSVWAGARPGDAVRAVRELQHRGSTVVLISRGGDPAGLAAADAGVVLGGFRGSSALAGFRGGALGLADAVVPGGSPEQAADFVAVARQAVATARRNQALAAGLNALGLALAATGAIGPLAATVWHNATSLVVVANSLRLLR